MGQSTENEREREADEGTEAQRQQAPTSPLAHLRPQVPFQVQEALLTTSIHVCNVFRAPAVCL
jgi:hypothetical protein